MDLYSLKNYGNFMWIFNLVAVKIELKVFNLKNITLFEFYIKF